MVGEHAGEVDDPPRAGGQLGGERVADEARQGDEHGDDVVVRQHDRVERDAPVEGQVDVAGGDVDRRAPPQRGDAEPGGGQQLRQADGGHEQRRDGRRVVARSCASTLVIPRSHYESHYHTRVAPASGDFGRVAAVTDTAAGIGRRERKKAETWAALHRAALDLFAANGFRETRVSDIAEAADVAPATFFRHFQSKEEVALVDVMARINAVISGLEGRPDDEGPSPPARRWSTRPRERA